MRITKLETPVGTLTLVAGALGLRAVLFADEALPEGAVVGAHPLLPCHRVVGADGALTGYGGGLDANRMLLERESRVLG